MTTSGTSTFNPTRNQIITRAGRQVGAWAAGEQPGAQELQDFSDALNAMVKEWQAIGLHLWAEVQGILWLQPGQTQYLLGPGSTDRSAQSYTRTTLSAGVAAGSTNLPLTNAAGFVTGQPVGVYLDSGALFWTTVSTNDFNPDFSSDFGPGAVGTQALPSSASAGNPVFTYASAMPRPLRILASRRMDTFSLLETPIQTYARLDYYDLPNKTGKADLNGVFYDPQLVNGIVSIWNSPQTSQFALTFTWMRQLQDFDNPNDTADFPQEWINCLTWNLADQMTVEYGTPTPRAAMIAQKAAESLDRCTGWDREPESIYAGVNFEQSTR